MAQSPHESPDPFDVSATSEPREGSAIRTADPRVRGSARRSR